MGRRYIFQGVGATGAELTFVGAAAATTPPSESTGQTSSTLVIPIPGGTEDGDLLLAVTKTQVTPTPPAGWTEEFGGGGQVLHVWSRVRQAGDPSSYTWAVGADSSRSGGMAAFRGGVIGDSAIDSSGVGIPPCPDVTAGAEAGAIFVAFVGLETATETMEAFGANPELSVEAQHISDGASPYSSPYATAIGVVEGLGSNETVGSDHQFTHSEELATSVVSIIIDPA